VPRRLDVHRPADHGHEPPPERLERRGDARRLLAERLRQHARYVEAVLGVELEDLRADEHQVEVARARSLTVERRSVLPPRAGEGAAPEDRGRLRGQAFPQHLAELLEAALVAAEDEIDGAPAHFLFAETGADDVIRLSLGHVPLRTPTPPI